MRMNNVDIRSYPKMAYYVKVNVPQVMTVPAIVNAFRTIGGIQRARIQRALKWGVGPAIRIAPLAGAYGEFTPDVGSNEIRIDTSLVLEFEAGRGRRVARAGNVYLLGVSLLHELIHWADDQDGIDRVGEEGEEFERLMYGRVIN